MSLLGGTRCRIARPATSSARTRSSRLLRARGASAQRVLRRGRRAAPRGRTATTSPTSSTGTSTTRTSATSAAASAPSRRASSPRTCAGRPYLVPLDEIVRRCREAWDRGATEVCLQGGIHPAFTGEYYLDVVRAIKRALPDLHVHAFSRARGLAGRGHARPRPRGLPGAAARRGARLAPGHGGRDPRRRGAPGHLPRQGHDRAVARGPRRRRTASGCARRRRSCSATSRPAELGAPPAAAPRAAARDRRLHRVRAAAVRAHGGADLRSRAWPAAGPTFGEALLVHAVAPARAAPADHERPGLVGEARAGRRAPRCWARVSTTWAGR